MKSNEFEKVHIKNRTCYYFNGIIRYLIRLKSGITYIFSHYFAKIKVDSYDSLPTEKRLSLHNVIIHIKSVLNKIKITATTRYFQKMLVSIS